MLSTNNLYLFIDGARLGSALCLERCTNFTRDGAYSDVYIGGTKMGALFGECLLLLIRIKTDLDIILNKKVPGAC